MLRRFTILSLVCAALVLLVAGGGTAATPPSAGNLVGEWYPDTSSDSTLVGHFFTITAVDQSDAAAEVGADSLDSYEKYCAAQNATNISYYRLSYSWDDQSEMGGCTSSLTEGHLYAWGMTLNTAYVHPATSHGEEVLKGAWGRAQSPAGNPNYLNLTAHRPAVDFLTHIKFTQILGKASRHVAELTTVKGVGEFRLSETDMTCDLVGLVSGEGAVEVRSVKIGGPNVVELDALTVKPDPHQNDVVSFFGCRDGQSLQSVSVTVSKSDPAEKDACPVGSPGSLSLVDGDGVHTKDSFELEIPKCQIDLVLAQAKAKKGSKVAVAETLNAKGY